MTDTYYIIKAKDCFGDLWPLSSITTGLDGRTFADQGEALAYLNRCKSTKESRRELRERNGWERNSIRSFEIHAVKHS